MTDTSRLHNLSIAMTRYGETSVALIKPIQKLGQDILDALAVYLGTKVYGVPPIGDWRPDDYRDAKYSFYWADVLSVAPIQMGIAICIPHLKDDGEHWARLVIEIALHGGQMSVLIGDGPSIADIPENYDASVIERICEHIYRDTFLRSTKTRFGSPPQSAKVRSAFSPLRCALETEGHTPKTKDNRDGTSNKKQVPLHSRL